ncbi:hypothetical protein ALQ04_03285 [Pseudomonas cichorii]|uniref:Uncharacterized protein n=1 Tax=Pseudomonas cichorii TaxID=36746 RepID=A0A3M4LGJ1_PSECI|nr:hypothetical protein ALQ04_03285 [Pseudomonas cichorii]
MKISAFVLSSFAFEVLRLKHLVVACSICWSLLNELLKNFCQVRIMVGLISLLGQ